MSFRNKKEELELPEKLAKQAFADSELRKLGPVFPEIPKA